MGKPGEPKPVKLFVALLSRHEGLFPLVEKELMALFGPIDSACGSLPWAVTDYYEKEMGTGLLRRFVSFAPLISPEALAEIKLGTQGIEEGHHWIEGERKGRRVNIDPGYVDTGKVVLASTKGASHRIYLRSGIYGEVTLLFQGGSFQPLVYPVPQNAPHVSAGMNPVPTPRGENDGFPILYGWNGVNVLDSPEGQSPKATDVSPWYGVYTYPDYLWPETVAFFMGLRSLYFRQLKQIA